MRDLILMTVIFGGLPVAVFRPWIGVLLYSWIGYMNPHRLTWGYAYDMPFAKIIGIATLAGFLLSGETKRLPRTKITGLLLAFWIWITLTTLFANYPTLAWPQYLQISKILLLTFVTMFLFQDLKKMRYLVLTITLSISYFGVKSGIVGLLSGFRSMVYAYPSDSFFSDNNGMALVLNMILPLLVMLGQEERRVLLKGTVYMLFGLTVLGILSTFSRGGFIGLVVTLVILILQSRHKMLGLTLIFVGGLLIAPVLSDSWYNRITSISEYKQDRSAQRHLEAWDVPLKLALESPLAGGGFRTLQPEIYRRSGYADVEKEVVAHSIFFQVLSDHGFVGLSIFLVLIASTLASLGRVGRITASAPEQHELRRLAQAIRISIIAFLASGTFLSVAYFDLFYHLIAIAALLTQLARQQVSASLKGTERSGLMLCRPGDGLVEERR